MQTQPSPHPPPYTQSPTLNPDSPPDPTHPTLPAPLLAQMKRLFTLHLRANQKRTIIHRHMQQQRYMDVFHGPPYDRVQHWNRCLMRVEDEYEEVERRCRGFTVGGKGEEGKGWSGDGREGLGERAESDGEGGDHGLGRGGEGLVEFVQRVRELADEVERLVGEIEGVEEGF